MATRVRLSEIATLSRHGYRVDREPDAFGTPVGPGWTLTDPDGAYLMIDGYGCVAPTQWEGVAEGLSRIES